MHSVPFAEFLTASVLLSLYGQRLKPCGRIITIQNVLNYTNLILLLLLLLVAMSIDTGAEWGEHS